MFNLKVLVMFDVKFYAFSKRMDLCFYLKKQREKLGISQKELANCIGISPANLCRLEHGKFSPTLDTFIKVCFCLNLSIKL